MMDSMKISDALELVAAEPRQGEWEKNTCLEAAKYIESLEERLHAYAFPEGEFITLDELKELVKAKQEGRAVVLPCKVGDTVYPIDIDRDLNKPPLRVTAFRFVGFDHEGWIEVGILKYRFSDFGKTVFLTREAAEAALGGAEC